MRLAIDPTRSSLFPRKAGFLSPAAGVNLRSCGRTWKNSSGRQGQSLRPPTWTERPGPLPQARSPAASSPGPSIRPLPQPCECRPIPPKSDKEQAKETFYVKLRAEADRDLMDQGKGKLHIGFHLDPVHTVHWNNLAEPLHFEFKTPKGVKLNTSKGTAPKVKAPSDIDPREFLIEVSSSAGRIEQPLELEVSYFACDDEEGWCRAVTHRYEIELRRDRDAGTVRSAGGGRGFDRRPRPGGRGGFGQRRKPDAEELLKRMDANGDGVISRDEARGPMVDRFNLMDADGNGTVSREELKKRLDRRGNSENPSQPQEAGPGN